MSNYVLVSIEDIDLNEHRETCYILKLHYGFIIVPTTASTLCGFFAIERPKVKTEKVFIGSTVLTRSCCRIKITTRIVSLHPCLLFIIEHNILAIVSIYL